MVNQWQKNAYGGKAYLGEMFLFIRLNEISDGFNGIKNKEKR